MMKCWSPPRSPRPTAQHCTDRTWVATLSVYVFSSHASNRAPSHKQAARMLQPHQLCCCSLLPGHLHGWFAHTGLARFVYTRPLGQGGQGNGIQGRVRGGEAYAPFVREQNTLMRCVTECGRCLVKQHALLTVTLFRSILQRTHPCLLLRRRVRRVRARTRAITCSLPDAPVLPRASTSQCEWHARASTNANKAGLQLACTTLAASMLWPTHHTTRAGPMQPAESMVLCKRHFVT